MRGNVAEATFEGMIAKIFPKMIKDINLQIRKSCEKHKQDKYETCNIKAYHNKTVKQIWEENLKSSRGEKGGTLFLKDHQ